MSIAIKTVVNPRTHVDEVSVEIVHRIGILRATLKGVVRSYTEAV